MDLEAQAIVIGDGEEVVSEETIPLTDEEVLAIVKEDLEAARKAKDTLDDKIQTWKNLYEGKPLGNEQDGRSTYVAKEAQKAVNWWIPNAMKPFMSSNDVADFAPRTFEDVGMAKSQTTLINYQFNNSFPKYQFLHTSLQCFASEGTVVARTGWIHEDEEEVIPFEGINEEQLAELEAQGAEIEVEDQAQVEINSLEGIEINNIFKGTATISKTTVSRPDAEVIKIEDFFIIGETIESSEACIQRIDTNRSALRKQDKKYNPKGIYTNVDDIKLKSTETRESGLGQQRQYDLENHGTVDDDLRTDKAREEITIFEYYGNIDIDQDGIAEPIVCVWSGSTIIRLGENPFPDKEPPFIGAPFMPIPFNFFGNALPHFLEDVTNIKTALTRTALDLMGNSTNGMKHVQKGSIDALNMRRLKEAKIGTVVEWLDKNGYEPEIRADIPSTLMPLMEYFTAEGENESGITRYNQGLDAKSLNKRMALNTKIPMADGSVKNLGDIVDGDRIIGRIGTTTVVKAHEIGMADETYELATSLETLCADGDHYWIVHVRDVRKRLQGKEALELGKDWYHLNTREMFDLLSEGKRLQLPRAERPEFEDVAVDLEIKPYQLGAWLGDGHTDGARITSEDGEILAAFGEYRLTLQKHQNSGNAKTYGISSNEQSGVSRRGNEGRFTEDANSFHNKLRACDLVGHKHIPTEYFYTSYADRLELIRGLMDTDGAYHSGGSAIFSQNDNTLLWDMHILLKSMGWRVSEPRLMSEAGLQEVNGHLCMTKDAYQIFFTAFDNPFTIERKASRWVYPSRSDKVLIKAIRRGGSEPMRCLTVDAEDRLFAVGEHWTMTRNTATGITAIMGQAQMRTWETVTRFAEQYMKPLFRKWIAYNQEFLDTKIAVRVAGENYQAVSKDDIAGEFDLTVNVAIAGQEEMKAQKISATLQMVTPLVQGGILPPNHVTKMIAELEELSGFKELSQELKQIADAKTQAKTEAVSMFMDLPDEAQTQIMQMAMQQMNPEAGNPQQGNPQ